MIQLGQAALLSWTRAHHRFVGVYVCVCYCVFCFSVFLELTWELNRPCWR
jgi:hypothetical protein